MSRMDNELPSIEKRFAEAQTRIGAKRYNSEAVLANFPSGSYIYNRVASGDNIRRWACGIGDLNHRFLDSEYARKTKYGCLVAPPLFLQSVCFAGIFDAMPFYQKAHSFHSGSEWEFYQPVLENDQLDFRGVGLAGVKLAESKFSGRMIVGNTLCEYRNQRNEVTGMCRFFVHSSAGKEVSANIGKYKEIAGPYRYSEEELYRIEADKAMEEMRGNRPRYWEEANEGDVLGPLVIGPHTIMESIGHFVAVWGCMPVGTGSRFNHYFHTFFVGKDGIKGFYDPRINAYVNGDLPHLDSDLGKTVGAPGAYDNGAGRECLASILMTNWMGDDGFLWKYSIQFRKFVIHGDTNWFQGKIVHKYVDDGRYCVDIEHWADNQRGEKTTTGTATIILPSIKHGAVKYPTSRTLEDVFPGN